MQASTSSNPIPSINQPQTLHIYLGRLLGVRQGLVHCHVAELVPADVHLALVVHARHLYGRSMSIGSSIHLILVIGYPSMVVVPCEGMHPSWGEGAVERTTCVLTECGLKVAKEAPSCCVAYKRGSTVCVSAYQSHTRAVPYSRQRSKKQSLWEGGAQSDRSPPEPHQHQNQTARADPPSRRRP